jgi:F-type H+-transporting ATPase subunit b
MLASIPSLILLDFIANDTPGLWTRLEPYLDFPGFEAWKFVNLAIFVGIIVYVARRMRLSDVFRDRRESIQRELAQAQQERDAAVAKLKEVEERLARLDTEVAEISQRSKREAAEERERIARSTETEIAKLGEQAQREIESAGKAARHELRRYTAEQSVRLAEEMIRREMKPEDDARLIDNNIRELGGAAR